MHTTLPAWVEATLRPGFEEIDGVFSYHPDRAGLYMTGADWPDVTDASPVPKLRQVCLAEFRALLDTLQSCANPPTLLSVCDGGGHPSAILAAECLQLRVISLDLSLEALRFFAPKMHRYFGLQPDRIARVHGSAVHLPIADRSIDAIVGVAAIHHLQLLHTFFRECARVLRPNGLVQFSGERLWNGAEPDDTDESDITRTSTQYCRALLAAGFSPWVGTGEGEIEHYARNLRLPRLCVKPLRPFVPRLRGLAGRCATVTVKGSLVK